MMPAISIQPFLQFLETLEARLGQTGPASTTNANTQGETAAAGNVATAEVVDSVQTNAQSQGDTSDPNVQGWLDNYYSQQQGAAGSPGMLTSSTSYQPAAGAGVSAITEGMYGPDAVYEQALANQIGNSFAAMTGEDPGYFTAQLPGIPSQEVQQGFDQQLAYSNAQRLLAGEPIDTAAYWSDPGSVTIDGQTFTSQQLGFAGDKQSSGPEPIWISDANQIPGTDTFTVPGYSGTVSGIQPGHFYTLDQLQQAGLQTGQPEGRFVPGSWSTGQDA